MSTVGRLTLRSGMMELGMLAAGCIITIMTKNADNSYSRGWGGDEHLFAHPWTQCLFMFWAETLNLVAFFITKFGPCRAKAPEGGEGQGKPTGILDLFPPLLAIPMFLDLLGTSISSIGLLYVSASVWQMLRGSMIVFSCILTAIFLKRKTPAWRWVAVGVTVCGLVLVGLSGVLNTTHAAAQRSGSSEEEVSNSAWKTILGIILVLVAMLIAGTQVVVEEVIIRRKHYVPMQVVGMEGLFGSIVMSFIVLPIVYFAPGDNPSSMKRGSYDNAIDAFIMMGNNVALLFYVIGYIVFDALFNFFGVTVTSCLSAVHRTMIDTCRGVIVWAWQLMTFYCINERFGEEWTKYSGIQVAGFVLLILGTLLYNGIIKLPGFSYETEERKEAEKEVESETPETKNGWSGSDHNNECDDVELSVQCEAKRRSNDNACAEQANSV
eukprot:m51a1_g8441 putative solute carrier family 35 member f6 (437) ;mRNA; r:373078-374697